MAFCSDLAARLRPFGVSLSVLPSKPGFDARKLLDARSVPAAAKATGKVNDLRDRLRLLQDKTHLRDEGMLRQLGLLGFPELVAASVQVGCGACKDGIIASYALQSVGNLAMEDANRQRFADLGVIELVIEAMRAHMGPASLATSAGAGGGGRVQKDAIVALRHLAYENDASKKRVLDSGGVEAVVAAMNAFGDNAQVQRQACGAVAVFAVHSSLGDAGRSRVLSSGGLQSIISAMKRWPEDSQLLAAGLKALALLVSFADARSAAREAGVAALVEGIAAREGIALGSGASGGGELGESIRSMLRKLAQTAEATPAAPAPAPAGGRAGAVGVRA